MQQGIKIEGLEEVKKGIMGMRQTLPIEIAQTLSKVAVLARKGEYTEMKKVFDRPTPYTLRSLYTKSATVKDLTSKLWVKGKMEAGKGTPAEYYLAPQIFGGPRRLKRHESALRRIGILPPNLYCVPAKGADLNAYGNMKTGQIIKILSYFQAFGEAGYRANITEERRKKMAKGTKKIAGITYFAIRKRRGKMAPGIYMRTGGQIKMLIVFVKRPHYEPRLLFWETAREVANKNWKRLFDEAMERTLEKARKA